MVSIEFTLLSPIITTTFTFTNSLNFNLRSTFTFTFNLYSLCTLSVTYSTRSLERKYIPRWASGDSSVLRCHLF